MLRLKENVDIQTLKNYGFEVTGNYAIKYFYRKLGGLSIEDDTVLVIENREVWLVEREAKESNEHYFGDLQLGTIYDLIKDDLLENEEEKKW